jgi:hypothetical protein
MGVFQTDLDLSPSHLPGSQPSVNTIGLSFIHIILPDCYVWVSRKEWGAGRNLKLDRIDIIEYNFYQTNHKY